MAEHASTFAALMLLFGATTATAQTHPPVTPVGAYEAMSPGNQNVARALYDAQLVVPPMPSGSSRKPLTLDQIAVMKKASSGWGQVFRDMQAKGLLLKDKTLAQVVSRYNQTSRPLATSANRATPKTNGDAVARGWRTDEAIAAPAALAGPSTLEHAGPEAGPEK
ncbi:MAG TPA: hypothetical protein VHZ49_19385 [Methylomirabilota bacterium]|jgi:hypothetical protein|nr:hypothetical protein [Methylomirabilota bacterium]